MQKRLLLALWMHTGPRPHELLMGDLELAAELVGGVVHQIAAEAVMGRPSTGVWVVKRHSSLVRANASAKDLPLATFSRVSSSVRNAAWPFVHVEGGRLLSERAEQTNTADTQQDLLHDARGAVAPIDAEGEIAIVLLVFRSIGIEQIDGVAAHIDTPCLEIDLVQGDANLADQRLSPGRPGPAPMGRFSGWRSV
jgi:hypothetical protein